MLDPQDRRLLHDALRPPPGYQLDHALITTFSLDLLALLSVPLAFTVFQLRDEDEVPEADPLALLEALRRYAGRLTLFCQAGQIAVPRRTQLLLGYLENSVFEVKSRRGGAFHPKVSILRFDPTAATSSEGDNDRPVQYRLLCGSRNLTFDRSWDTLLTLDGILRSHRQKAIAVNHPLADFVEALPGMGVRPIAENTGEIIEKVAKELRRVEWTLPEGYEDLRFWPFGIDGHDRRPLDGCARTLVIAPFVSDGFVSRLTADGGEHVLVSRREALDALSEDSLRALTAAYCLNPAAEVQLDSEESEVAELTSLGPLTAGDAEQLEVVKLDATEQLRGLHAKLFLADEGWNARVLVGSANATDAAFERNVEFLVELTGKKSRCGIDAMIGTDQDGAKEGRNGGLKFGDLLQRYERTGPPTGDSVRLELERLELEVRRSLATSNLVASVEAVEAMPPRYRLVITSIAPIAWPDEAQVACRPITLRNIAALPLSRPTRSPVACFESLSFEALTSFFAFELTVRAHGQQLRSSFVLNLPVTGLPADRTSRILLSLLRNRQQLLRYLLMLLADDDMAARQLEEVMSGKDRDLPGDSGGRDFGLPLLEPLLQTLDRHPDRLEQIAKLVDDLQKSPEGQSLLSEDFMATWRPIWETRLGAKKGHE